MKRTKTKQKVNLLFIFCSCISTSNSEFAGHVPLRLKRQLGENLELHVLFSGELNTKKLMKEGIRCHRFTTHKLLHWLFLMKALRRLVLQLNIHVISNVWNHYHTLLLKIASLGTPAKIISRVAGDPINIRKDPKRLTPKWLIRKLGRFLEKYSILVSDGMHFVSLSLETVFRQRYSDLSFANSAIFSQGVDTNTFSFSQIKSVPMRHLLFVGRISRNKGIDELFHAFESVSSKFPEMTLTLAGPGKLPDIPDKIAQKVCYLGMVDHEKLPALYGNYDILLLPSHSEGLPNVILEAMASGLVVIASAVGDIPVLLAKGRGFVIQPKDASALAVSIERAAKTPISDIHKMINLAREHVVKHHSFEATGNRYLNYLHNNLGLNFSLN